MGTGPKVCAVIIAVVATATACSSGPSRSRAAQQYVSLQEQTDSQVTSLFNQLSATEELMQREAIWAQVARDIQTAIEGEFKINYPHGVNADVDGVIAAARREEDTAASCAQSDGTACESEYSSAVERYRQAVDVLRHDLGLATPGGSSLNEDG